MDITEEKAILTLAMMAAFADGENSDAERMALSGMARSFGPDSRINVWEIYQEVVARRRTVHEVAAELVTPEARAMAYDMAAGVCEADGSVNDAERAFLDSVRNALHPGGPAPSPAPAAAGPAEAAATPAAAALVPPPAAPGAPPPLLEPVDTEAIDKMIINYSILNGALEFLPGGLSTLAIMPLQMRMVYRIGARYGYTLDRGHIRDFLATAGVGLASQAVENVARHLLGGLAGGLLGGLGRAVVSAGTGGMMGFAGTYALGQLANRYYAGGRKMESAVLRDTYKRLLRDGQSLFGQHAGAVQSRARSLNPTDVINLVRSPQ